MLALVDYYNFLEEYEPDTRIAIDEDTSRQLTGEEYIAKLTDKELEFGESSDFVGTPLTVVSQYVVYADVRNRSYAV